MAETTKIAWCDSTFNPWIGCTKVSVSAPDGETSKGGACDNCYAEEMDRVRFSKTLGGATKEIPISHWGPGAPRYRTKESKWNEVHKWNKRREIAMGAFARSPIGPKPEPHLVFCASLADVLDNEVHDAWRQDLWRLVQATPYLDWLLVTKRIGNAERMFPAAWIRDGFPRHVRLLISVSNQYEADRDVPKLLALPCKNGISYEPALGPVDWSKASGPFQPFKTIHWDTKTPGGREPQSRGIQWLIVGGESKQGDAEPRKFEVQWALDAIAQCKAAGVPCFVKQLGSRPVWPIGDGRGVGAPLRARAGEDPSEWPEALGLNVREFPK